MWRLAKFCQGSLHIIYSLPFDAFRAKKIYIHLRYRFAQATRFRTRNEVYIVEHRRFRSMLFERSAYDVICIEIAKLYSFPFHTFRAK